jgi:probable rRNA maturation factor
LVILEKKVAGLTEVAFSRFLLRARKAAGLKRTVHVLVTSSAAMRSLNRRFRRKNKPTDVLSFPAPQAANAGKKFAGEIAISADIAAQNALRLGHSLAAEIKVLALHGVLHLAGFDHERDNGVMRRKETQLRRLLRLPESLIERGQPAAITPRPPRERRKKRRPA